MLLTPFNFTWEFEMQDAARIFCPSWFRVYNCLTLLISKCVANTGFLLLQFFSLAQGACTACSKWDEVNSCHFTKSLTLVFDLLWPKLSKLLNLKRYENSSVGLIIQNFESICITLIRHTCENSIQKPRALLLKPLCRSH